MEEQIRQEFIRFCRHQRLAITPQRLAIYQALAKEALHPSAETVYKMVREKFPTMSLGTVYKTLETFLELGLIRKVNVLHETARYDANLERHHHAVCLKCKQIWDLYDERLEKIGPIELPEKGFQVLEHSVHVLGLCTKCQQSQKA